MTATRPVFPVEHLVARVLLVGGLLGLGLIVVGLGLYAAHGGFHQHVLLLMALPGLDTSLALRSMRLFADEVAPALVTPDRSAATSPAGTRSSPR